MHIHCIEIDNCEEHEYGYVLYYLRTQKCAYLSINSDLSFRNLIQFNPQL